MSEARDEERAVREEADEMAQAGDRMEKRLDGLDEDIDEAKTVAAQRQDAPDPTDEVAGDWEGEASGAGQGDDATDSGRLDDGDEDDPDDDGRDG